MRDCEIQTIKRGGWRIKRDEDGTPYRFLVEGVAAAKGDEKLARAIVRPQANVDCPPGSPPRAGSSHYAPEIMLSIHPDRLGARDTDPIFRRFKDLKTDSVALLDCSGPWLNAFQTHVNRLAANALEGAGMPADRDLIHNLYRIPSTDDGQHWRWSTRQPRRTIAWYIANEPFGTVAGMRQFGHAGSNL